MNKKFILPVCTLAFSACLLSAAGIRAYNYASAETAPSCAIVAKSLQLKDNVYILYAVDFRSTQTSDETGLLVWDAPQVEYTYNNANTVLSTSETVTIDSVDYEAFTYTELSAKQMTDVVYASAYVERDGAYYYSEVKKYSVLEYAYNKLGLTEATATEDDSLQALLKAMLAYGAAAQTHFGYKTDSLASADDFTYVRVANANFEDLFDYGLFKAGSTVTVTPEAGYVLSESGSSIFTENTNGTLTFTVPADKTIDVTSFVKKTDVSEGLTYSLSSDGSSYSVTGIGTCEDTDVVIPSIYRGKPVKSISSEAFQNNTTLASVAIPEGVTNIVNNAFNNCSSLTSVTIPESVTNIGNNAFKDCSGLTRVDISDVDVWCGVSFGNSDSNPLYYAKNLYLNGALLEELVISEGVTNIGDYAFRNCSSLTSVTIPESVTKIGWYAFEDCIGLTRVDISDVDAWCGVSFSGRDANPLYYAKKLYLNGALLEDLVISEGVTEIKTYAFSYTTSIKTVTIPTSVTKIGSSFDYCTGLTGVYITDIKAWIDIDMGSLNSLLQYGKNLYLNNVLVENLVLSADDGYTKVKNFYGARCLKSVTLPEGITEICDYAFRWCSNLQTINIPTTVKTIGKGAFEGCDALQYNVYDNAKYLGNAQNSYLMLVVATSDAITSCTIHSDTKIIASEAFRGCGFTAITIPNGVTEIHESAFRYCRNLESITIPDSVTNLGAYVFDHCSSLSTVTIGTGVKEIGWFTFGDCSALTTVNMPGSIINLGNRSFDNCTALTTINFNGTKAQWQGISKYYTWNTNTGEYTVVCTDGNLSKANA